MIAVQMKDRESFFPVTLIAVLVAFVFRVIAVREHWGSFVPLVAAAEGPVQPTINGIRKSVTETFQYSHRLEIGGGLA